MTQEQIYYSVREVADEMGTLLSVCDTLTDAAAHIPTQAGAMAARRLRAAADKLQRDIQHVTRTAELLTEGEGIRRPYDADKLRRAMKRNGIIIPKA